MFNASVARHSGGHTTLRRSISDSRQYWGDAVSIDASRSARDGDGADAPDLYARALALLDLPAARTRR